ncbi:hypothetical protein [Blastopirellula marina]|nr:hypothetical protein [Blastopirellula marina]
MTGTLVDAKGKWIKLKSEQGNDWALLVESKPQEIIIRGEAERGWVRPGMYVMFDATIDRKFATQTPVTAASVFSPSPTIEVGITAADTSASKEAPSREEEAGSGEEEPGEGSKPTPQAGGTDEFGNAIPGPGGPGGSPGSSGQPGGGNGETARVTVIGRVTGVTRDGRWNVTAGRMKVIAEVSPQAEIKVELSDPNLISMGDKVKGTVWYTQAGQGVLKGRVEIEAAKPFAAPEDPKEARRKRREAAAADKAAEPKSIFAM